MFLNNITKRHQHHAERHCFSADFGEKYYFIGSVNVFASWTIGRIIGWNFEGKQTSKTGSDQL